METEDVHDVRREVHFETMHESAACIRDVRAFERNSARPVRQYLRVTSTHHRGRIVPQRRPQIRFRNNDTCRGTS